MLWVAVSHSILGTRHTFKLNRGTTRTSDPRLCQLSYSIHGVRLPAPVSCPRFELPRRVTHPARLTGLWNRQVPRISMIQQSAVVTSLSCIAPFPYWAAGYGWLILYGL